MSGAAAASGTPGLPAGGRLAHLRFVATRTAILGLLAFATASAGSAYGLSSLVIPFTLTLILLTAAPPGPANSARSILIGYSSAALAALLFGVVSAPQAVAAAVAVAVTTLVGLSARALHPPAVALAILFSLHMATTADLLVTIAGAILLSAYSRLRA